MQDEHRRRFAAPICGAFAGLVGALLTLSWSSYAEANLPATFALALRIVSYPFVFPGALVTYFLIVGDNWQPSDYYRYTLPISLVINTATGALLGWGWRAWRQRKARNL